MNTIYTCGIKINPITVAEVREYVEECFRNNRKGIQLTGVNIEQFALIKKDKHFKDYVNSSDIVNIDGTIVYLYLKMKFYKIKQRTLCADILEDMLTVANEKGRSIYLLGAEETTIKKLVEVIGNKYPGLRIVGYHNGFFKDEKMIAADIAKKSPDYLFIGMPSPFKERFIATYKNELNTSVCFGVGGMFDILAGVAKRAPEKFQKAGLEWLYRITQNPKGHTKRIFRALIPSLYVFIKHLFERKPQVMK